MHDSNATRAWCRLGAAGLVPNTITFNSLISACGKGRRFAEACRVREEMKRAGVRATIVTHNALIAAAARGGHWAEALAAFEEMQGMYIV
eukprot:2890187-Pyramimonas_sp.AAC.2